MISLPPAKCTYHRPFEALGILLELLQRIVQRRSPTDHCARVADIVDDGRELVWCGRLLVDVEVELCPLGVCLVGVIAGLVLCCCLAGVGRHLLEEGERLGRGRCVGLVEEGYDVFGFALRGLACCAQKLPLLCSIRGKHNLQSRT